MSRPRIRRGWIGRSRFGALAFLPRRGGKQQVATRFGRPARRGADGASCARAISRGCLLEPRCRGGAGRWADGSASRGFSRPGWSRPNIRPSFSAACLAAAPACLGCRSVPVPGSESDPAGDRLQLSHHHAEAEHDQSGAGSDGAREDQGIAETEFLDRNPESDRSKARQQQDRCRRPTRKPPSNSPPAAPDSTRNRQGHDTVILCASPTANCGASSAHSWRQADAHDSDLFGTSARNAKIFTLAAIVAPQ